MLVKLRISALALAVGLVTVPSLALGQAGPSQTATPKLSDAWLSSLPNSPAVAWSHAFALRQDTAAEVGGQRRRLIAELETLIMSAQLDGRAQRAKGVGAWRQRLDEDTALPARTPGRHDLPWLGAHLRQDPPLDKIALWGSCEPPAWVEIWHLAGVTRLPWRPGMALDDALDRLAASLGSKAYESADSAWLITPTGEKHRRGIAAWSAQATPLTPGSRVMLELPGPTGLSGALPLSDPQSAAGELINQRLPDYLTTRLPGDDCTTWSEDT